MQPREAIMNIQVQYVLFNTPIDSIRKSILSFCNSAKLCNVGICFALGNASKTDYPSCEREELAILSGAEGVPIGYTFFDENTGYGKGHNLLAQDSDSDVLIFCNPDLIVSGSFFREILAPFVADDAVGIVEARQSPIEHPKAYSLETGETEWASGACMAIWTKLFQYLGGFDARTFFMYSEDVDLSWRVRLYGYKVIYRPEAVAYHPKRLNSGARWMPTSTEEYYASETALLLAYKWNNNNRVSKLLEVFENGTPSQQQARKAFLKRKAAGTLPNQIVDDEQVASFYPTGTYAKHRFDL